MRPHNPVLQEGLVTRAKGYLGWKEKTGQNDGRIVEEFLDGDPGLPWCAGFIRKLFDLCGQPIYGAGPGYVHQRKALLSVSYMEDVFKEHHNWVPLSFAYQPKPGDIVFCKSRLGSDTGPGRHVALVEYVDFRASELRCISGNWRNSVTRHALPMLPYKISGFGWI